MHGSIPPVISVKTEMLLKSKEDDSQKGKMDESEYYKRQHGTERAELKTNLTTTTTVMRMMMMTTMMNSYTASNAISIKRSYRSQIENH